MPNSNKPVIDTVLHKGIFYVEKRSNIERRCGQRRRILFERRHKSDKRQSGRITIDITV